MNEIADSFFDVLNELKTADKTNAVGETMNSESRDNRKIKSISEIERGEFPKKVLINGIEREYNGHNPLSTKGRASTPNMTSISWVYDKQIFSVIENKMFMNAISAIHSGDGEGFSKFDNGDYLIQIENKLVFTDGDYDYPYISKIIEFMSDSAERINIAKEYVKNVENGRYRISDAEPVVSNILQNGFALQYTARADRVYEWGTGKSKGRTRREALANYLRKQNRAGNDKKSNIATQISNEPSSSDGGFSMPDNQNYSTKRNTNDMRFHNLRYIEKVAEVSADANVEQSYKDGSATSATDYNVTDLYDFVKRNDKEFTPGKSVNKSFLNSNGTPLSDRGLPDWTDGDDLIEFLEEKGYNYDAIILDEGGTGGYGDNVLDRGLSYVIKDSSQIKSVTDNIGTFSNSKDINYSESRDTEYLKLDKNGWLHRNANVINAKNGNIYNITLDIAKTKDGRTLLYATKGKTKKVGRAAVNSLKIRGSQPDSNFLHMLSQSGTESQEFSEKRDRYEAKQRYVDRRIA